MASNPLFSDQDMQAAGGSPSAPAQSQPAPGGSLFSTDEINAAGGGQPQPPQPAFNVPQEPKSFIGKFGRWAENVAYDLKNGTDFTGVGSVLKAMGAHGVYSGNSEKVGDFIASLPLGLLEAAQGASQLAPEVLGGPKGQTVRGLKNVAGGILKAAQEPLAFVAPEETPLSEEGLAADAASAAAKATAPVGKAAAATKAVFTDIPKQTESKVINAIGNFAEDSGFERGEADTLKGAVSDLASKFQQRAQSVYKELDEDAPGFQELRDKIGSLKTAYRVDPAKANEIGAELKTAQENMDNLLDPGQRAQWKIADSDYARYKALQRVQGKASNAATDLTSDALQDVGKLQSGMQALGNRMSRGNPIDVLHRAFGDDAGAIREIVQDAANLLSIT